MASVYSTNTMLFGPMERHIERRVSLTVMQGPSFKLVSIAPGGMLYPARLACTAPDCPVSVRFDHGPLKRYSATNANGVSMSLVDPSDFLVNLRVAKKVSIVFPLSGYGDTTFVFDIAGFRW